MKPLRLPIWYLIVSLFVCLSGRAAVFDRPASGGLSSNAIYNMVIAFGAEGTNSISATTATNIAAYQAALMQERTEITLSAKGILNGLSATNNDGAMFGPDTPGTTTCGIQEAWNSINKGTEYGPRNVAVSLRFGDGNFFYTNCLVFSNNYTTSIRMEGNDLLSTRLVFAGTAGNTNTLWIRGGGNANTDDGNPALNLPMHFWARHLAFSSILENTNVLVCVTNVSGFQFDQCRFVSWRSMTNNTSGSAVSVASVGNYPGPQGLVGVVAGNVNDHWGIFTSCSWQGLASGGYLFTDHLMIDGAKFAEVGTVGGLFENNLFPNTSPFSLGAGIIRNNGLDTHITDAHFYSTRIGIAALNFSGVTTPDSLILDGFQTEGATYDLVAFNTNGIAIYLKDPRLDYTFGKVSTNGAGEFSLAASALDVKTVLYGTGGLTNPSTNLNANAITSGTIGVARLPGAFLWATNVDGTITNINGGGVSVGTSKVAITNGGAVVTLGVSPGMIRTLNNGVSTLIDSNTITTGNITNATANIYSTGTNWSGKIRAGGASESANTLEVTGSARVSSDFTVSAGNIFVPNTFAIRFSSSTKFTTPGDGILSIQNNAGTDFSRLNFGGTTAAFPAWSRVFGNMVLTDGAGTGTTNNLLVPGSATAANGFSSRSNVFFLAPTNAASAGQAIVSTGLEGSTAHTKWLSLPQFELSSAIYSNRWSVDESGAAEFVTNYFTYTVPATANYLVSLAYITVTEGGGTTVDSVSECTLKWTDPFASANNFSAGIDTKTIGVGNGYNNGSTLAPYTIYAKAGTSLIVSNYTQNSYDGGGDTKSTNFVSVSVRGAP